MTDERERCIQRHVQRLMTGGPAPSVSQVKSDLQCGSHAAQEGLDRMMSIAVSALLRKACVRPDSEPAPEWRR